MRTVNLDLSNRRFFAEPRPSSARDSRSHGQRQGFARISLHFCLYLQMRRQTRSVTRGRPHPPKIPAYRRERQPDVPMGYTLSYRQDGRGEYVPVLVPTYELFSPQNPDRHVLSELFAILQPYYRTRAAALTNAQLKTVYAQELQNRSSGSAETRSLTEQIALIDGQTMQSAQAEPHGQAIKPERTTSSLTDSKRKPSRYENTLYQKRKRQLAALHSDGANKRSCIVHHTLPLSQQVVQIKQEPTTMGIDCDDAVIMKKEPL